MSNATVNTPHYKLIYFDNAGNAEHIRYILAFAGVEYEDKRIQKEQWPEIRRSTPFGKLPVLEIDGEMVAQSNAIARYLARRYGLIGKDEREALKCDVLVDTLGDLQANVQQAMRELDPIKREELRARVIKEQLPFYLSKFNSIIKNNNGLSVGTDITWADFVFAALLAQFEVMYGKSALNAYPALKGLKDRIHALPNIRNMLDNQPQS